MGTRLASNVKQMIKGKSLLWKSQRAGDVPKGHVAVYVGEVQRKRCVVTISYLNHPSFKCLLNKAEEEFGFHPIMGALSIPCKEDAFIDLTSRLRHSK